MEEKKSYLQNHKGIMEHLFLATSQKYARLSFNHWINYKRKLFDEENSLALLNLKVKEQEKFKHFLHQKRKLARVYQQDNYSKDEVALLEVEISKLEEFFSLKYFFYKRDSKKNKIVYTDIQEYLKEKELYVDFIKVDKQYGFFSLNFFGDVTFKRLTLKKSSLVDALIQRIVEDENKIEEDRANGRSLVQKRYAKLYTLIMENIDLAGINSLIISPDGMLSNIPFEAFYDKKEEKYVLEKLAIRYIPSAKEFVKLYQKNIKPNEELIVFADVDFGEERSTKNKKKANLYQNVSWASLPYTKKEAKMIKQLYPEGKFFLKQEASEVNLLTVSSPKILHLATHGSFFSSTKSSSPLLNAFIFLSAANRGMDDNSGEGIVSALELSGLDLRATELVVLSACETAVGKVEEFEGISSISKAFMSAGTNNIMMSLWNINDKATARLIGDFYRLLNRGSNYHQALREAKLLMLKDARFSHPYFWSALIISGQ